MQAALVAPGCFNCALRTGEQRRMQPLGNGAYWCPVCKAVNQLDDRLAFHPAALLSLSALPLLNIAYVASLYLLNHMPLALQVGMGALLVTGYIWKGLRTLAR